MNENALHRDNFSMQSASNFKRYFTIESKNEINRPLREHAEKMIVKALNESIQGNSVTERDWITFFKRYQEFQGSTVFDAEKLKEAKSGWKTSIK